MNEAQREHFRKILLAWKQELMQEVDRTVHHMQDDASNFPIRPTGRHRSPNSGLNYAPVTGNASCSRKLPRPSHVSTMVPMVIAKKPAKKSGYNGLKLARLQRFA